MSGEEKKYRIFLSAAEPSADAHCAGLITALKKSSYNIEFIGVGGFKMAEAGCELLEVTAGKAAMIYNAFRHIIRYMKLIRRIKHFLKNSKIDLVIVCDSPAFNFHVAKAAKKAGIKTVFYVAPQLWAWAGWRIKKLQKYCDKLCCILPFEEDWFSQKGIDVSFVGNPLLDELGPDLSRNKKSYSNFEPGRAHIALMPGSRAAEIDSLWLPMQRIAMKIKQKYAGVRFTTVAVDTEKEKILKDKQIAGFSCEYKISAVSNVARSVDFTIVASGSATLQVAAAGCPMVIMYQSSKVLWHLVGRWLVKTKHLSLVNILADKKLVPEFMPYFASTEPIAEVIENLLADKSKLFRVSRELVELTEPLAANNAGEQVKEIVIKMLE